MHDIMAFGFFVIVHVYTKDDMRRCIYNVSLLHGCMIARLVNKPALALVFPKEHLLTVKVPTLIMLSLSWSHSHDLGSRVTRGKELGARNFRQMPCHSDKAEGRRDLRNI